MLADWMNIRQSVCIIARYKLAWFCHQHQYGPTRNVYEAAQVTLEGIMVCTGAWHFTGWIVNRALL